MKNIKWLRSVIFCLVLTISALGVLQCYGMPRNHDTRNLAAFDAEKENIVDGILLGTSVISHSWQTPVAWKNYGLSIYHLSTNLQPFGATNAILDYVDKSQDIKYVVIDIHGLRTQALTESLRPTSIRTISLNIPDLESRIRILASLREFVADVYEFYGIPEDSKLVIKSDDKSYVFPFLTFHSRWVGGLKKADYITIRNKYLGSDDRDTAFDIADCTKHTSLWDFGEVEDIDEFQKSQLQTVFDYAKEKNLKLLFINMPSFRTNEEQQEMRDIIEYCKSKGYDTIDFSSTEMLDKLEINPSTDFVNLGHLNALGGTKVTNYICEYLIENGFYTVDHRGDEAYAHWDEATESYMEFYQKGLDKVAESQKSK